MSFVLLPGTGKYINEILDNTVKLEEADLPYKNFVARMGKWYKILLSIGAAAMILLGLPMYFIWEPTVGILCFVIAGLALLILPTMISYKCYVSKTSIKEKYFILFIKIEKEILWEDIKYKKIRIGQNNSITFYNKDKKKLMSFDGALVGYNHIVKMAKRSSIIQIK